MKKQALHNVLKRPLITEKASELRDTFNQYAFEVAMASNKVEIRNAIEDAFDVKVSSVHTSIMRGKNKRVGRRMGRRPNWKKAVVSLKAGHDIDFFEGI